MKALLAFLFVGVILVCLTHIIIRVAQNEIAMVEAQRNLLGDEKYCVASYQYTDSRYVPAFCLKYFSEKPNEKE